MSTGKNVLASNNQEMAAWIDKHMCPSKKAFESLVARGDLHDLITLSSIDHEYTPKGSDETVSSKAFVFSSPALLQNIVAAVRGKAGPGELNVMLDGTYKLTSVQWVLVDIGTTTLRFNRSKDTWQQHFIPFMYLFTPTETGAVIAEALRTLNRVGHEFFDLPATLPVAIVQSDHSPANRLAASMVWRDAKFITCWAHVARQALSKNMGKFRKRDFKPTAEKHLHILHRASNYTHFLNLWEAVKKHWIAEGEEELATFFQDHYIQEPWGNWFAGAAGVNGVCSSNNTLEAEHRVIKEAKIGMTGVPMSTFLSTSLPKLVKGAKDCEQTNVKVSNDWLWHANEIPHFALSKAERIKNMRVEAAVKKKKGDASLTEAEGEGEGEGEDDEDDDGDDVFEMVVGGVHKPGDGSRSSSSTKVVLTDFVRLRLLLWDVDAFAVNSTSNSVYGRETQAAITKERVRKHIEARSKYVTYASVAEAEWASLSLHIVQAAPIASVPSVDADAAERPTLGAFAGAAGAFAGAAGAGATSASPGAGATSASPGATGGAHVGAITRI